MTRAPSLSTARSTLVPYRPAATSRSELRVVRSRCMPRLRRTTTTTRPCFRRHSDGRILACYSRHGVDDNYYQRVSLNPDDLSAFGPEVNIGPALGASRYTYANLIETKHGIFNFVRCARCGESVGPHYSVSTDGGALELCVCVWV